MITEHQLLPCGRHAIMVQLDGTPTVMAVAATIARCRAEGQWGWSDVVDVVPAASTVLITVSGTDLGEVRAALLALDPPAEAASVETSVVRVPVRYDGPDLDEVAALTGLSRAEVVAAHTGTSWRAAFGGFAPGFAYLVGGDARLDVPRRSSPRTAVPAGSVAIAGGYCAVYPRRSPGGWRLLGTTDLTVWDLDREPPGLLTPGTVVRFVDVEAS